MGGREEGYVTELTLLYLLHIVSDIKVRTELTKPSTVTFNMELTKPSSTLAVNRVNQA